MSKQSQHHAIQDLLLPARVKEVLPHLYLTAMLTFLRADRNHDFNVGPAVGGFGSFRGPGMGRGGARGPQPPRGPPPSDKHNQGLPMGMVMTPMGPMPAQMAMGMMGGGMDFNPAMINAGMSHPMMNMGMNGIDQMVSSSDRSDPLGSFI